MSAKKRHLMRSLKSLFKRSKERQREIDEHRRGSAASPHTTKSRKGTRRARDKRAIDDQA